jgi:hypothetical protein
VSNSGGLYGAGLYFSDSPSKADQYVPAVRSGRCIMLFARVLVGSPFVSTNPNGLPGLRRPPCLHGHTQEACDHTRFDSVLATAARRFKELVVYDRHQCYPEFIVEYERTK